MARDHFPQPTGAIDLDMEQLLSSGALEAHARPSLLARLWAWLCGPCAWGEQP